MSRSLVSFLTSIKFLYGLLVVAMLALLWGGRLTDALFVDEAGSAWVIQNGPRQVFERALYVQGQSPFYYLILWGWAKVFGMSEFSLRCPSVLSSCVSCLLFLQIGAEIKRYKAFCFGLPVLLTSHALFFASIMARPYALGVSFTLASVVTLLRWLRSDKSIDLFAFILSLSGMVYCHPTMLSIVPMHLILILMQPTYRKPLKRLLLVALCFILLVSPAIWQMLLLTSRLSDLSIHPEKPSLLMLIKFLLSMPILLSVGLLISLKITLFRNKLMLDSSAYLGIILGGLWYLLPKLTAISAAILFNSSFLIERYSLVACIGEAILIGSLVAGLSSKSFKYLFASLITLILALPLISRSNPDTAWKPAIQLIHDLDPAGKCQIYALVGFIESKKIDLVTTEPTASFIISPLHYYGFENAIALPAFRSSPQEREYFDAVVLPALRSKSCVFLLSWPMAEISEARLSTDILISELKQRDYSISIQTKYGLVSLWYLQKPD